MEHTYNDLAIILAWPDATIRGDEKWMMFFRKIGLVKNLNFKIGHTGVILVNSETRSLYYYDFGRYITPRGLGRARSPFSDPRLRIRSKAVISDCSNGTIENLEEIALELEEMKEATQGEGRLFFSVATGLSFKKAKAFADELVLEGSTPYGAFARGNNNCSRFITRLLVHASKKYHFFHGVLLPESFKASPLSNVVNVRKDRKIYIFDKSNGLKSHRMTRVRSFFFTLKQLKDNFYTKLSAKLPDDKIVGSVNIKQRPESVPSDAHWLGGVGEGAWYHIQKGEQLGGFEISRYTEKGELEYAVPFYTNQQFNIDEPYTIDYDSHMIFATVLQGGKEIKLYSTLTYTANFNSEQNAQVFNMPFEEELSIQNTSKQYASGS